MSGAMMRAIVARAPGDADGLVLAERTVPAPAPGEVLIEVAAAGINRPDILQRQGRYDPPPGASDLLGLEVAGTIAVLGEDVGGWRVGDPVCALLPGGGYAGFAVASAGACLPVPAGLSMIEAAALPETVFTVWTNVITGGRFTAGDHVLIHGGSSGIGTMAIQMVSALGGAAYATAGSAAKIEACRQLGALRAIDYKTEDFVSAVMTATDDRGVDIVLDMVGGDYLARNMAACASGGRIVMIATLGGARPALPIATMMAKRLILTGSMLRPRSTPEKAAIALAVRETVWPLIEAGTIKPVIDSVFPLAAAADAHRRMESSDHIGKIVLEVGSA